MDDDPLGVLSGKADAPRSKSHKTKAPTTSMEPAEQLRTVDFSSLKFKEDKRTGGRSASSAVSGASAAPVKAGDVFLAKPTPETGSALFQSMLDEAKKSSSSGSAVLSDLSGGGAKAPLSASGYGLFDDAPQHDDSSERTGLVAPLGGSARMPAVLRSEGADEEEDDQRISDLRVGQVLQREEGLEELFGTQSSVRPKGAPPAPVPKPALPQELFAAEEEASELLDKLGAVSLRKKAVAPSQDSSTAPPSLDATLDESLARLASSSLPGASATPSAALDDDLFSMLKDKAGGDGAAVDDGFDFDKYIAQNS